MEALGEGFCRHRISKRDAALLDALAQGLGNAEIGKKLGVVEQAVKNRICKLGKRLHVDASIVHPRIIMAIWWSWPIFRIGAGYEDPRPIPRFAADVIEHDRVRVELQAQEERRQLAVAAD